jgi:hypothetical protein
MRAVSSKWRNSKGDVNPASLCPNKHYILVDQYNSLELESYSQVLIATNQQLPGNTIVRDFLVDGSHVLDTTESARALDFKDSVTVYVGTDVKITFLLRLRKRVRTSTLPWSLMYPDTIHFQFEYAEVAGVRDPSLSILTLQQMARLEATKQRTPFHHGDDLVSRLELHHGSDCLVLLHFFIDHRSTPDFTRFSRQIRSLPWEAFPLLDSSTDSRTCAEKMVARITAQDWEVFTTSSNHEWRTSSLDAVGQCRAFLHSVDHILPDRNVICTYPLC